jgi:hypothetical protein
MTMKSSLLVAGLLLFATAAQAQHRPSSMTGGGNGASLGNNGSGGWGSGSGWSSGNGTAGRPVQYENPRTFFITYARNDGPFVPSTYMSYEEAVSLGQQLLAEAERAARGEGVSLGEIARTYRAVRVPTMKLQSRVLQDDSGRLEICNLNGNDCHRP